MKRVLFIDRDGTLIKEPPVDYQVDSFEKLEFMPGAITAMSRIATLGYELAMATNQDGLGTASFPEATFWPAHNLMLKTFEGEGVRFDDILIDRSTSNWPEISAQRESCCSPSKRDARYWPKGALRNTAC